MAFGGTDPNTTRPHKHTNSVGDGGALDETTQFSVRGAVRTLWQRVIGS